MSEQVSFIFHPSSQLQFWTSQGNFSNQKDMLLFFYFFSLFKAIQEVDKRHHISLWLNSFPQLLLIWPLLLSELSSIALKFNFFLCHWIFCIALKIIVPQTYPPALLAPIHIPHPVIVQLQSQQLPFCPFRLALCVLHYFMAQLPFVTRLVTYSCSHWASNLIYWAFG